MKYVNMLGLLAVAAVAIVAFAASASATTITGPNGETTPPIHAVSEGGHVSLHNGGISSIECDPTLEGAVKSHGVGKTATINLSTFIMTNCTNEWIFDVVNVGSLEIHYAGAGSGHGSSTVTWTGLTFTGTRAGLSCSYQTNNTPIGTLTGGNRATLKLEAVISRHGGSFLCGSSLQWTGSFVTTGTLAIHA